MTRAASSKKRALVAQTRRSGPKPAVSVDREAPPAAHKYWREGSGAHSFHTVSFETAVSVGRNAGQRCAGKAPGVPPIVGRSGQARAHATARKCAHARSDKLFIGSPTFVHSLMDHGERLT